MTDDVLGRRPADWYARWVVPLLRTSSPERAHRSALTLLQIADNPVFRPILRAFAGEYASERLQVSVAGLHFRNPLGLAAGFDKNGEAVRAAAALGFSHVEAGSVTRRAQEGNPAPRMFRLPEDRAVINRLGMPSKGAEWVRKRLEPIHAARTNFVLGINIGKMKMTPLEEAADEYRETFSLLLECGDYFVVNVSSPNTQGLRALQHGAYLDRILQEMQSVNVHRAPLFLKVAPDVTDPQLKEIVAIASSRAIAGFIATNTTVERPHLRSLLREEGGLSGPPLRPRAIAVVRSLHRFTEGKLPIIGLGGVSSGRDIFDFIQAGASLVQLYTAMVYQGPFIVRRYLLELEAILDQEGFRTVADAVGTAPDNGTR